MRGLAAARVEQGRLCGENGALCVCFVALTILGFLAPFTVVLYRIVLLPPIVLEALLGRGASRLRSTANTGANRS